MRQSLLRSLVFLFAFSGLLFSQTTKPVPKSPKPTETASTPKTLRFGVTGASISAGMSSRLRLADAMAKNLHSGRVTFQAADEANLFTFMDPMGSAARAIGSLEKAKGLQGIVALDYLFWFAYRRTNGDDAFRENSLRKGLKTLDRLKVPIWLGDIPHITDANVAFFTKEVIPSKEELARLNGVVHEWAKARPRVTVMPVDNWLDRLKSGQTLTELPGAPTFKRKEVLAADRLHLSRTGVHLAAQLVLREIAKSDLIDVKSILKPEDVLAGKGVASTRIRVRVEEKGRLAKTGKIKFDFSLEGLAFDQLIKLSGLADLREPSDLAIKNPFTIADVPDAALGLKRLRVRAYRDDLVSDWKTITLKKNKLSDLKLELKPGAKIKVRVLEADGTPAPNLQVVSITEAESRGESVHLGGRRFFRGITDAAGCCTLSGLDLGEHLVRIVVDGNRPRVETKVPTGKAGATEVEVTLP